jgi:Fe-S cluster biogenesis protein NfuA
MAGGELDPEAVQRRVVSLDRMLFVHRGGIELRDVSADGKVELRYTGMCTGCTYRPVCSEATVRPALLELEGVESVEILGGRIDAGNQGRLAGGLDDWRRRGAVNS